MHGVHYAAMSNLLSELRRRNVFRAAAAYIVIAWVIAQVFDLLADNFGAPDWVMKIVLSFLAIGFVVVLLLAWAYELTPDGVKKSKDVPAEESITPQTGNKLTVIAVVGLVVALAFIAWDKLGPETGQPGSIEDKSVAVLPFADLSQGGDQEWFADGLTEEILNALARLPQLKVTARTSSFEFKNTNIAVSEIANRLGVAHIVEGSVRRIGDDLRVTAQLIRAQDGFHLWSQTYDRKSEALFDVQEDIAENIASTLDVVLDEEARNRMLAFGTRDVSAFIGYLEGRKLSDDAHARDLVETVTLKEANVYFERAMELDPTFSAPAIMHTDRYAHFLLEGAAQIVGDGEELDVESAQAALQRDYSHAIRNAPDDEIRIIASINREFFAPTWGRMSALLDEFEELMNQGSASLIHRLWMHEILLATQRLDLAAQLAQEQLELDPMSVSTWLDLIDQQIAFRNFDEANRLAEEARQRFGSNRPLSEREITLAILTEYRPGLVEILENFEGFGGDYSDVRALHAAISGDDALARQLIDEIIARQTTSAFTIWAMLELGEVDAVGDYVRAVDARPSGATLLAMIYSGSGSAIWFDPDDAPNFGARLREAGVDIYSLPRGEWPAEEE
jgi:TolB-like protein